VVAGGIPIAVGAAQGLKMQKSDAIVTCMFGDGAVNRGPFLEGLNWAVLFKLPVLFVCEDNGVAAFTRAESVTAGPGGSTVPRRSASRRSRSTATARWRWMTPRRSRSRRCGAGKGRICCMCAPIASPGHTSTDAAAWRPAEEVEEARSRDPIARLGAVLAERGVSPSELGKMIDEARAEMADARRLANAAAWPAPHVAFEDVQDTGAVAWSK
jgi:pyruvate dehydrogenase E1 component alpha subunit